MNCQFFLTTNNYIQQHQNSMSENAIFPGDKIASIEEYEAGYNTLMMGMRTCSNCRRKGHR